VSRGAHQAAFGTPLFFPDFAGRVFFPKLRAASAFGGRTDSQDLMDHRQSGGEWLKKG
jgi:hypothetical protein